MAEDEMTPGPENDRIRRAAPAETPVLKEIVNDAAAAFRGVIPPDCWHEPYMPLEELMREIDEGIEFWVFEQDGGIAGMMGIQDVDDVTLIRHAYVRTSRQHRGIGGMLLADLLQKTARRTLVGTWRDAAWAISFYEKHGFWAQTPEASGELLRRYWKISDRQIETSLVLAREREV